MSVVAYITYPPQWAPGPGVQGSSGPAALCSTMGPAPGGGLHGRTWPGTVQCPGPEYKTVQLCVLQHIVCSTLLSLYCAVQRVQEQQHLL